MVPSVLSWGRELSLEVSSHQSTVYLVGSGPHLKSLVTFLGHMQAHWGPSYNTSTALPTGSRINSLEPPINPGKPGDIFGEGSVHSSIYFQSYLWRGYPQASLGSIGELRVWIIVEQHLKL